MYTFYLSLLTYANNIGTDFERLPQELIEYIINKIIIPQRKTSFIESLNNIRLQGTFSKINYIKNMLEYNRKTNPQNYSDLDMTNMCASFIKDPEYVIQVLNTCTCCIRHLHRCHAFMHTCIHAQTHTCIYDS